MADSIILSDSVSIAENCNLLYIGLQFCRAWSSQLRSIKTKSSFNLFSMQGRKNINLKLDELLFFKGLQLKVILDFTKTIALIALFLS